MFVPPPGEPLVKDFTENHTDTTVSFTITPTAVLAPLFAACAGGAPLSAPLRKLFKLDSSLSTANMHLFNTEGAITRYASPAAVIDEFFEARVVLYARRKEHLMGVLGEEVSKLANKARFITAVSARARVYVCGCAVVVVGDGAVAGGSAVECWPVWRAARQRGSGCQAALVTGSRPTPPLVHAPFARAGCAWGAGAGEPQACRAAGGAPRCRLQGV